MPELKAALVDLDGTLVETRAANYQAYASALKEFDIHISYDEFQDVAYGKSWRQFLPPILERSGSHADAALIARRKSELYPTLLHLTQVNTALAHLLRFMKSTCRIALVTTASSANAQAILDFHDLRSIFDDLITGDDVQRHKPAPDAYVLAAARFGVQSDETIVFEDSDIGIASARAFGAEVLCMGMFT